MISRFLDRISEFLAHRKGLLPAIGLFMIILNLLFRLWLPSNWMSEANLCLHVGLIIAIVGFMLVPAL